MQTQNIFLDFLDEPLDSQRRRREGMYASYTFGQGEKAVKVDINADDHACKKLSHYITTNMWGELTGEINLNKIS